MKSTLEKIYGNTRKSEAESTHTLKASGKHAKRRGTARKSKPARGVAPHE